MRPQHPNWNDLKIFLEVARSGSFSKGARSLGMDVSTVSRHIAQLEQSLNCPVFERVQGGLKTTPNGAALVEHVEGMESHALSLVDSANLDETRPTGTVRVGTMEGIASFYLSGQLVAFREQYPQVQVELVTSSHHVHVSHREADLFLSFFPAQARGVDVFPVGQFSLHLYAAPAYLAQQGSPESVDDLASHQFVSYIDDLVQLDTVHWLNEVVPRPRCAFRSSSMVAQMHYAAAGGGIVMLPSFMNAERLGLVRVLEEAVRPSRIVWLTVHSDLQYMPRIKAVTAFLGDAFRQDFPLPPGARERNR